MDMWYFARICAHVRSWREFAKCCSAHFPSFFSVHVDTYDVWNNVSTDCVHASSVNMDENRTDKVSSKGG